MTGLAHDPASSWERTRDALDDWKDNRTTGQDPATIAKHDYSLTTLGQLTNLGKSGGPVIGPGSGSYGYDGWNLVDRYRIGATPFLQTTYTWDLGLSGTLQRAGGVGGLLAIHEASGNDTAKQGQTIYPLFDGNGNIVRLLDANAATVASFDYDGFGNFLNFAASNVDNSGYASQQPFGFSTKYRDKETGLLYYGFRYLDPVTGRWVCRDPLGERGGVNLYGLMGNDGVGWVDLLGLTIGTFDEDETYREKIIQALEDMTGGEFSWERFEKVKDAPGPTPADCTATDEEKKKPVYVLHVDREGTAANMWARLRPIVDDARMTVIAQQEVQDGQNGKETLLPRTDKNACCKKKRVTIAKDLNILNNVVTGTDDKGNIQWETDSNPTPWEISFWHELAGHYRGDHFKDPLNDAKTNPTGRSEVRNENGGDGIGPPDVPISIENEARTRWNQIHPDRPIRMRVPWYRNGGAPL